MHDKIASQTCSVYEVATRVTPQERRTRGVVAMTAGMMVIELVVGFFSQSLALIADGWHMATHAGALGLAALAYWFARTRAQEQRFTFGTGKVKALAGYTNAILLLVIALLMIVEAGRRLLTPVSVHFAEALPVAILGLIVNLVSAKILEGEDERGNEGAPGGPPDHNLQAAYLHVLADAFTSFLAIIALAGGYYAGLVFLDPVVAIVGSLIIFRWGVGLCRASAQQLLDVNFSGEIVRSIRERVESLDDARVVDVHVWELGSGQLGGIVSVMASLPRPVEEYRSAILTVAKIAHLTVEVTQCPHHEAA